MQGNAPATPTFALHDPVELGSKEEPLAWFAVGTRKLWTLSILTFTFYTFYWFERQYRAQKRLRYDSTRPVWRAMFSVFYAPDLFRRIEAAAGGLEIHPSWESRALAAVYIVSMVGSNILDRVEGHLKGDAASIVGTIVYLMVIGIVYPVAKVQATVNAVLVREQPNVDLNEEFTIGNWIACIVGGVLLVAMVYWTWFPPDLQLPGLDGSGFDLPE